MSKPVAILIVHGGDDPGRHRWLEMCLARVRELTTYPDYRIYLWNNDAGDSTAHRLAADIDRCRVIDADPGASFAQPHAQGLQGAYEAARAEGAQFVVTLDSDAFPVRSGWLTALVAEVESGAALAGVWRDERPDRIEPYVHASCLCTSVDFVERHALRFDDLPTGTDTTFDTLSRFTRVAVAAGLPIHPLRRANRNSLHYMIGGLYGGLIYHHGAGSRRMGFGEVDAAGVLRSRAIRDIGTSMAAEHWHDYHAWLRGDPTAKRLLFVLGMHRSGTTCLTACLEACGADVGDVNRSPSPHQPAGNLEQSRVIDINDAILDSWGGAWDRPPPRTPPIGRGLESAIAGVVADLEASAPSAIKDPRMTLTAPHWLGAARDPALIGTFRHPSAVARSLWDRQRMPAEQAFELWRRYNEELVRLHRQEPFPLVEFDLADRDTYCRQVAALAGTMRLQPRAKAIRAVVREAGHRSPESHPPMPPACEPVYAYLRQHRFDGALEPGTFPALLVEWGGLLDGPIPAPRKLDFELWAWNWGRRLPGPVRAAVRPMWTRLRMWTRRRAERSTRRLPSDGGHREHR